MYKLSRYWNSFTYFIVDIGVRMIWDQTKVVLNTSKYKSGYDATDKTARFILTNKD